MNELDKIELDEMEKWNDSDEVAYRNRNGCEFEREYEAKRYSFWDLKESMEEM